MNKRKVTGVKVFFNDGTVDDFDGEMTFSESINARKKAGFANLEEWVEYHITWVTYVRDLPPVVAEKTPEEMLVEANAILAEKLKNPSYAGTADGRDFFYDQEPTKLPSLWRPVEEVRKELTVDFDEAMAVSKARIMRAYGLTEEGLKRWMEQEDSRKQDEYEATIISHTEYSNIKSHVESLDFGLEEFLDIREGYSNGDH